MTTESLGLRDAPDWAYLLRDIAECYRALSSGGSERIGAHQRLVRGAIGALVKENAALSLPAPEGKPVTAHLRRALGEGRRGAMAGLVRAMDSVGDRLRWEYGYEKLPRGLASRYGYAEFAGPRGPVLSRRLILGVVMFAPGCVYPAHAHAGIDESYVCLSGAVSQNHQGVYVPGAMIFNPSGHRHRITVSDHEPALLLYAWTGPEEALRDQKMVFDRVRATAAGAGG